MNTVHLLRYKIGIVVMDKEFEGLTAIVTGAGSGIGLEVAKELTIRGAKVFGFDVNQGDMAPIVCFNA